MEHGLNTPVDVFGWVEKRNELGEADRERVFLKRIFGQVVPSSSSSKWTKAGTEILEHSHRFKFRAKSVKNIQKDWVLEVNGEGYEVVGWDPDFKCRAFVYVYAVLRRE